MVFLLFQTHAELLDFLQLTSGFKSQLEAILHKQDGLSAQLTNLERLVVTTQEAIDKFASDAAAVNTAQQQFNDQAIASISKVAADQANLLKQIQDLKNTIGQMPADAQAKLDAVISAAQTATGRTQQVVTALQALDEQIPDMPDTPPAP